MELVIDNPAVIDAIDALAGRLADARVALLVARATGAKINEGAVRQALAKATAACADLPSCINS